MDSYLSTSRLYNFNIKRFKTIFSSLLLTTLFACGGSSETGSPSQTVPSITPETPETPVNKPIQLTIEAEDFQRYVDTSPGNEGSGFYNSTDDYLDGDVDIVGSGGEGQFVVGWTESGEWLEYDITLSPGTYIISTSVARDADDYSFASNYSLLLDGEELGSDTVENTGSILTYESHNVALTEVEGGSYTLRLAINSGGFNLDKIIFTPDDGSFIPTPTEQPLELPEVELVVDNNPILAKTAVAEMGIGINLGNGLDAPREGAWAAPKTEEQVIIDFKEAGFKHVRIPVSWDNRTARTAPYSVDTQEMDRIEEVIDWALAQDLYVILNVHHDYWFKRGDNTFTQNNKNRFDAIWLQIVERFKNKSAKLLFEILNEPEDLTTANVDELNTRVLEIIRRVNPTRLVVFSGNGFSPINALLSATAPDTEDEYLIGNFHAYDPVPFARQCLQRWGTESDKDALENIYIQAQTWSIENDIPVTVNEFGAAKFDFTAPENACELEDRLQYLGSHVEFATKYGISATYWDDADGFGVYDRINGVWGPEKDILVAPNLP
jgi:endoglucanase